MSDHIPYSGGKIDKPGIYSGLPITAYHSDSCIGPSISSGGLRTLDSVSPAHYWATSYLNPNRVHQEDKDAFNLGRAAHTLILGEDGFKRDYVIRPDFWDSWRTKEARVWRDEQKLAGLTVLEPSHIDQIRGMAAALALHPTVQAGLLNGEVERSIVWKDAKTGIWLKARPDVLPVDSNMIVDLKTTSSADAVSVRRSIADYGYHMQLALAFEGMKAVTGRQMTDFVLVFVETKLPYAVNIKPLDIADIIFGRRQIRRAIDRFAECLKSCSWPAYDDDEVTASLPSYYRQRLDHEAEAGLLPALEDAWT